MIMFLNQCIVEYMEYMLQTKKMIIHWPFFFFGWPYDFIFFNLSWDIPMWLKKRSQCPLLPPKEQKSSNSTIFLNAHIAPIFDFSFSRTQCTIISSFLLEEMHNYFTISFTWSVFKAKVVHVLQSLYYYVVVKSKAGLPFFKWLIYPHILFGKGHWFLHFSWFESHPILFFQYFFLIIGRLQVWIFFSNIRQLN